jgi:hypothetical protein
MNPIVAAALISGGWATVVAALGYVYNRATANATIRATNANAQAALDAAHAAQLWEKKAEAYVDAIAALTRRQEGRRQLISPVGYDDATQEKLQQVLAAPQDWDWARASARLTAYAAQPVLDAMHETIAADTQVSNRLLDWKFLFDRAGLAGAAGPTNKQITEAFNAIQPAAEKANAADSKIEALIRADLALKPSD